MSSTAPLAAAPQLPLWPFVLLFALLMLGLSFTRDRWVSRRAISAVPFLMVLASLASVRSAFGLTPVNAGAWLLGVAASAATMIAFRWPRGVRWDGAARRLFVPGSWVPLVLFVAIFASRFVVGTAQALHLPLLAAPRFGAGMALLYGVFSGIFLGRAAVMWRALPAATARLASTAT